ncbi:MAG: GAF domain-containing protein [Anaerolineae bacterium]|nr:GAF domain-containing protein [Anaerolineae bacterium]
MSDELNERLAQVSEILIALAGSPIPSQQFQVLADYAGLVVPYDFLAFCLVDEAESGYFVFPLDGVGRDVVASRPYTRHEGVVGRILHNRRSEIISDMAQDPDANPDLEGILTYLGLHAALILPIRQEHKVLGALYFARQDPAGYSASDLQIARLLAAGMASALESARYYQRLADERSTLAAVLTSTQDGVLVVNEEGLVLLANPAFEQMMGLSLGALAGQRLVEKVDDPALLALFGPETQVAEIRLPDGGPAAGRITQARAAQVVTEFGEFVGWTAVLRDITVLKELEQMKSDFVNTVSHDLKNPINTITLAAELLEKFGPLTEKQSDMHTRILQTAVYMNELVSDLLDLGKIQAGLDLRLTPFDFRALVEDVLFSVAGAAEQKGQQIETQLPAQLTVEADERRLKQVLLNLVGNAIKYTPPQGHIRLVVTVEKAQVVVAVQDNGIGIPAADLPYVFDKFYRVQNETTRGIKGTGLGLAITWSIVEAHHGRIWVESAPGKGSTFAFALPLFRNP